MGSAKTFWNILVKQNKLIYITIKILKQCMYNLLFDNLLSLYYI